MTNISTELKACPFCGGRLIATTNRTGDPYSFHPENDCILGQLRITVSPDRPASVAAWNSRAGSSAEASVTSQSELHGHAGADHAPGSGADETTDASPSFTEDDVERVARAIVATRFGWSSDSGNWKPCEKDLEEARAALAAMKDRNP